MDVKSPRPTGRLHQYVNEYRDRNPVDDPSGTWIDISRVMSTFRVEILNPPTEVASTIQGFAQARTMKTNADYRTQPLLPEAPAMSLVCMID